jgi:hypothetical protein
MPWQEIEARVAQVFSRKGRAGAALPDLDLFGEQVQCVAVASNAGRPRVPLRIMISLLLSNGRLGSSSAHQLLALIEACLCKPSISQLRRIVWITPGGFGNVLVRVHWLSLSVIPSAYLNVREHIKQAVIGQVSGLAY